MLFVGIVDDAGEEVGMIRDENHHFSWLLVDGRVKDIKAIFIHRRYIQPDNKNQMQDMFRVSQNDFVGLENNTLNNLKWQARPPAPFKSIDNLMQDKRYFMAVSTCICSHINH